ncbi:MAG: hypothetical protein WC654_03475 [Patescibacteria group bacterium]
MAVLSRIQYALLDHLRIAAIMIGTPGCVPVRLLDRIAEQFVRATTVSRVINELERIGFLQIHAGQCSFFPRNFSLSTTLVGEVAHPIEPEPLKALILRAGYKCRFRDPRLIGAKKRQPRESPVQFMAHALVDHHMAEHLYDGLLPAILSREVFARLRPGESNPTRVRTLLLQDGFMHCVPIAGIRSLVLWGTTQDGLTFSRTFDCQPTISQDDFTRICRELNLEPRAHAIV